MTLSVVVADDAALLRAGIVRLLVDEGMNVVGEAGECDRLLALVDEHQPNVCVVDVRMPPTKTTEGIEAAKIIRRLFPNTGVLLLSQYIESEFVLEVLREGTGGIGYLLKDRISDVDEFLAAVRRVAAGDTAIDHDLVERIIQRPHKGRRPQDELSDREREVLTLMAEGLSNKAIGTTMFLGERTVESHIKAIFAKLGLAPEPDDHRRVLAVLAHLRAPFTLSSDAADEQQ